MNGQEDTVGQGGDEWSASVAEFALGLLSPTEHADMARRIAESPALQAELRAWHAHFSALDAAFEPVAAPTHVWRGIESRLFDREPTPSRLMGLWQSVSVWRALAAACLLLFVTALGFFVLDRQSPAPIGTQLVAVLEAESSDVRLLASYNAESGQITLSGLPGTEQPVAPSDRDYELWVIAGDNPPQSLGLIPTLVRHNLTLPSELTATMTDGVVLAVSLEPKGGAPEGAPTGPIVALGQVTGV